MAGIGLLCAVGPVIAAPPAARYTDAAHRFSLVPPPGWTINRQLIPHYAVLVEPKPKPEDEAVTIGTYGEPSQNLTLDKYVQAARKDIAKQAGLTIFEEKAITLGGEKAYSWRMRLKLPGHPAHESRQVFCAHGPQVVILTLTALPSTIHNYDAAFEKTVASFRWEPGAVQMPGVSKTAAKPTDKAAPKTSGKR